MYNRCNGNLKAVLALLGVISILLALAGNYYVGNYRLGQMEKSDDNKETRLKMVESQVVEINVKMDILLEHAGLTGQYKTYHALRGGK